MKNEYLPIGTRLRNKKYSIIGYIIKYYIIKYKYEYEMVLLEYHLGGKKIEGEIPTKNLLEYWEIAEEKDLKTL